MRYPSLPPLTSRTVRDAIAARRKVGDMARVAELERKLAIVKRRENDAKARTSTLEGINAERPAWAAMLKTLLR